MDSYRFYLLSRIWYAVCWSSMITVNLVFMVQVAGLDPLQMVLVGTVLEASVFLFEVPTGVVADVVSRRLSVIIGYAIIGAGFCPSRQGKPAPCGAVRSEHLVL